MSSPNIVYVYSNHHHPSSWCSRPFNEKFKKIFTTIRFHFVDCLVCFNQIFSIFLFLFSSNAVKSTNGWDHLTNKTVNLSGPMRLGWAEFHSVAIKINDKMKYSSNQMTISLSNTQSMLLMSLQTDAIAVAVVAASQFHSTFAYWECKRTETKSCDNFKWNVNTNMTIWYVRNRLDQPNATIANQKRNKSLPLSIESFTRQVTSHPLNVKWPSSPLPRMHVIALNLSHCWRLILYAIIISVISRAPPPVNSKSSNNAVGMSAAKMLPTPAASTWPSNFFDADRIQCPSFVDNSACPCYKFEDGKYIWPLSLFLSLISHMHECLLTQLTVVNTHARNVCISLFAPNHHTRFTLICVEWMCARKFT